jgi:hypothetical protein
MAKLDRFSNFFRLFSGFQVVEHISDSFRTIKLKKLDFSKKSKNSIFGQFSKLDYLEKYTLFTFGVLM